MKALNILKNFLIGFLGLTFFGFAIIVTIILLNYNSFGISQFGDTSLIFMKNKITSENYKKGDLVLVESRAIDDIEVGNEIFVYKIATDGSVRVDFGVVGEVHTSDDGITFENGSAYSMKYVIGEATKVYNDIGGHLSIILSKWGFLFIVLVPSFLIFIYEFYVLVIEIKYGKEE